jgi:hypothetical protein
MSGLTVDTRRGSRQLQLADPLRFYAKVTVRAEQRFALPQRSIALFVFRKDFSKAIEYEVLVQCRKNRATDEDRAI